MKQQLLSDYIRELKAEPRVPPPPKPGMCRIWETDIESGLQRFVDVPEELVKDVPAQYSRAQVEAYAAIFRRAKAEQEKDHLSSRETEPTLGHTAAQIAERLSPGSV